jgi:CTP synthase (UTP-ammonia lyase)
MLGGMIHIGIVGDHDPAQEAHAATEDALGHAAVNLGLGVEPTWIATDEVGDPPDELAGFDGLLVAPGSPYRDPEGALRAVEHARTADVPLLATCAGMQHVVVELARHVLGVEDAHHAEYEPEGATLVVTRLACSLAGQEQEVDVRPGTRAAAAYGDRTVTERYACSFGPDPAVVDELVRAGVVVSGTDGEGAPRILELPDRRFFVATLFVPQVRSTVVHPHPLVSAFVAAAEEAARGDEDGTEPAVVVRRPDG